MLADEISSSNVVYQNATERWQDKSKHSLRDNVIKAIAIVILGSIGVIGSSALVFTPVILLQPTLSTLLTYLVGNFMLMGVGGSSIVLGTSFDWKNYSKKEDVSYDCINLTTTKSLETLILQNDSPLYRIHNLKKYGILSEKTAQQLQIFVEKYEQLSEKSDILKYKFPNLKMENRFTKEILRSFQDVKDEKKQLEIEWSEFQTSILNDLPIID